MKKLVNRINVKGRNLLLACVLGDADINKEGQVRFVHSWKQYEYIKWKFNLLRRNGIKVSNFFRYINTTGYKDYNIQYKFTVNVTMFSKLLKKALYENHRVYFKRKHLNRLDPQGLAIWFMDDGSILRRKENIVVFILEYLLIVHMKKLIQLLNILMKFGIYILQKSVSTQKKIHIL